MGSLHPYFGVYNKLQLCIVLQKEKKRQRKEEGEGEREEEKEGHMVFSGFNLTKMFKKRKRRKTLRMEKYKQVALFFLS